MFKNKSINSLDMFTCMCCVVLLGYDSLEVCKALVVGVGVGVVLREHWLGIRLSLRWMAAQGQHYGIIRDTERQGFSKCQP